MRVISGISKGIKLDTIKSEKTRPTLDRVKESLFNILQPYISNSMVLDLFAGSGALGIEALSRGSKEAYFIDDSVEAIKIITKNIKKTGFEEKSNIIKADYKKIINSLTNKKFDIIFIDPPYSKDIAVDSIKRIIEKQILSNKGIIILETDEDERDLKQIENINLFIKDIRKYGRVKLIFLCEGGK